ncbi:MAG TPA: GlxA family transcriptional regulator [Myxococcaceae bacterium]|nr:GlxA family transcriptional regulator [Myxococcaceae bacterium]
MEPVSRTVAIVAVEQGQVLDVTGPYEVFDHVRRVTDERGLAPATRYRVEVVAARPGPLAMSCGLRLHADRGYGELHTAPDTLLVAGGQGVKPRGNPPELLQLLGQLAPRVRRLGAICTGAFALAEAGLLDGRRATTHWASCGDLAEHYPGVRVDPEPIFVQDGNLYTSAGVTAGIDLALALVEQDCGYRVALQVARDLVLFLKRPGSQSQFSAQLRTQAATVEPLRDLQAWMADHLSEDLSVPILARRVAMSPRNFARLFRREVGVTPARYVERERIEAARRQLGESHRGMDRVAEACGFGTPETMRRAFLRTVRITPGQYRVRFRAAGRMRREGR